MKKNSPTGSIGLAWPANRSQWPAFSAGAGAFARGKNWKTGKRALFSASLDIRFYDGSYQPPTYSATAASGIGSARLLVTPQGPNDLGSYLVGLNEGFLIGGSLSPSLIWATHDAPNLYGDATVLGSYLPDEGIQFIPDGYFYGTTAFMEVQFQIASEWHYGWVRIRGETAGLSDGGQFYLSPPSWILDWSYDTRPNTPIFAGTVPEPSPGWLFIAGGVVWAAMKRRQNPA